VPLELYRLFEKWEAKKGLVRQGQRAVQGAELKAVTRQWTLAGSDAGPQGVPVGRAAAHAAP
jgi:hypothetical protein